MTKSVKTIALIAGLLFGAATSQAAVIYSTDCVETPMGATSTMSKGQWNTTAPSWASGYNNSFQTTGSAGTMTYTFSPAIDLSGYTNDTLKVYWGSTSNRPLKVGINGGADTQIDAISASADRSQVRVATTALSVTSISSLKFISSGGGNVFIFKIEIVGIGGSGPTPPPTPTLSNDATLSDLKVDGTTIAGFSANTTSYTYTVAAGVTTVPQVSATANHTNAQVGITQASSVTGQASVLVTAEDGTTTKTYTVQFSQSGTTPVDPPTPIDPPTPSTPTQTTLSLHETEIYEAPLIMGGYGGTLATFGGREYEVFYINRDAAGSNLSVSLVNTDKNNGITTGTSATQCAANDGWMTAKGCGNSSSSDNVGDEFGSMVRRLDMQEGDSIVMHVKGYSEFAMVGADKKKDTSSGQTKPQDNRYFEVYVDGQLQASQFNTNTTIRRYPITTGEHVIKVIHTGTEKSKFFAFSLQVAYIPKLKHLKGNDSTQVVLQTAAIKPITYFLKNRVNDATLAWNGAEATGINLVKGNGDTLYVQGNANCPSGNYQYTISATDASGSVVSSLSGSFSVETKVECQTGSLNMSVFANSAIKPVIFRCYTTDMNSVTSAWSGTTPAGLSWSKDATNHTLTLSGTPTVPGTYAYSVSVTGGNTLNGSITVKNDQPTVIPGKPTVLYLYKDNENDGLYNYITSSRKYGYFARPAADDMGDNAAYAAYDAVIISEDVDATNKEVLGIIRSLRKPVLNMKIFTYSANRLGWGDPDNGSVTNTKMHVVQPTHPIFNGLAGMPDVTLLSSVAGNKGLMAAETSYAGSLCLATVPTRGPNYDDDGDDQTFIHEVPAAKRGAKYLSLPIGLGSTANLSADGKKLFDNMMDYLTSSATSGISAPTLQITAFSANDVAGQIDQQQKTITVRVPANTNLSAVRVSITLADSHTFVTPANGETLDFSDTHYGVVFTVSDYINQVKYTAKVLSTTDLESTDAEGLCLTGDILRNTQNVWVRIYAANGQLLTTTNSDFSFENQPRGMYIVRSENSTLKVLH